MLFPAKRVAVLPRRFPAGMPMADGRAPAWWMDFVNRKYYYNRQFATAEQIFAALGGGHTRASTGTSFDPFGKLISNATNVLRRDYDPVTLAPKGILLEGARTIIPLYNRDFTNGAWAPTNVTAAKNQTGIDGASNAASSLTATASDGTILQTVTTVSTQRAQAAYVKRLVGTGTVEMTMDGGSTWTDITSAINGSTYTRVPTGAGLVQTLANPNMGFRIRTSGDAIAVDFFTNEAGAFVSLPVATTSASATRAADVLTLPTSPWFNADAGTLLFEFVPAYVAVTGIFSINNSGSATTNRIDHRMNTGSVITVAGVSQSAPLAPSVYVSGVQSRICYAFSVGDTKIAKDSYLGTGVAPSSLPVPNLLRVGDLDGGGSPSYWHLRRVGYWPFRVTDAEIQRLSAPD